MAAVLLGVDRADKVWVDCRGHLHYHQVVRQRGQRLHRSPIRIPTPIQPRRAPLEATVTARKTRLRLVFPSASLPPSRYQPMRLRCLYLPRVRDIHQPAGAGAGAGAGAVVVAGAVNSPPRVRPRDMGRGHRSPSGRPQPRGHQRLTSMAVAASHVPHLCAALRLCTTTRHSQ